MYDFNLRLKEGSDMGSFRNGGRAFHCLMAVNEKVVGASASDLGIW